MQLLQDYAAQLQLGQVQHGAGFGVGGGVVQGGFLGGGGLARASAESFLERS